MPIKPAPIPAPAQTILPISTPMHLLKALVLFPPWLAANWKPQDDTGGGGSSSSSLTVASAGIANFSGIVKYTGVMNGGFASVRTAKPLNWDWENYECGGLKLDVKAPQGNKKKFSILLWNSIPPPKTPPDGGYWFSQDFIPGGKHHDTVYLPFGKFEAYNLRGKKIVSNPPHLDLGKVKQMNFLIKGRVGVAGQEGKFWLGIMKVWVVGEKKKNGKCDWHD